MNPIERIEQALRSQFPNAELDLDPAATATGSWFLDARLAGYQVVVEWRPDRGFGVSSPELSYGESADEYFTDEAAAIPRVVYLLETRGSSGHPSI